MAERQERFGAVARLEVKALSDATPEGSFSGHGALFDDPHETSTWQLPSDWMDVVRPGAFKRTLAEHKARGTLPAMFKEHDRYTPIGAWKAAEEDKKGLYLEGLLATKIEDGAETYELMKIGAMRGLSIGFCVVKATLDEKTKTREILDLDLFEVSPVSIPAIAGAQVEDLKALRGEPRNIRDVEGALRDAGFTRTEAKALLAEGFKGLSGQRDAGLISSLDELRKTIRGE